ncbi:MAG TPA: alanine racemase, partial [bacterium]|nr:alanine racemase [bacterium]
MQYNLSKFKTNYSRVIDTIKNKCISLNRDFNKLTTIVVTKYIDYESVKSVINEGIADIGENRVQRIKDIYSQINSQGLNVNWHMIGTLQSNKIKYIAGFVKLIHSVNNVKLLSEINKYGVLNKRIIPVLIELNESCEESKTGAAEEEAKKIFEYYCSEKKQLTNVVITGLMTMAANTNDTKIIRKNFSGLREKMIKINSEFGLNL